MVAKFYSVKTERQLSFSPVSGLMGIPTTARKDPTDTTMKFQSRVGIDGDSYILALLVGVLLITGVTVSVPCRD